jgi:hypothetical protein
VQAPFALVELLPAQVKHPSWVQARQPLLDRQKMALLIKDQPTELFSHPT